MTTRSLVYIATGDKHRDEALTSCLYSRPYLSNISTCIYTNYITPDLQNTFDHCFLHPDPQFSYRDKILPLIDLPSDECIFLDSDAFLCNPISDIFEVCTGFDVAAVKAPVRIPPGWCDPNVPKLFPELNTGVLYLSSSEIQSFLVRSWLNLYDSLHQSHGQSWDQASFRSVLWSSICNSSLRFYDLPPEVNIRTTKPWFAGRGLPAYVIHGRFNSSELSNLLSFLNQDIDRFRTWVDWLALYPESSIRPRFDNTFS